MLEIIKVLLETISKSFSMDSIRNAKKTKKLQELGTEIFLLYSTLNSIISLGNQIIMELENGLNWMKRKVKEEEPNRELYTNLPLLLHQQEVNILKLVKSIKRLRFELEIIAPEAYIKIYPLIHKKFNTIQQLSKVLSGNSPQLVSISETKLIEFLQKSSKLSINHGLKYRHFDKKANILEKLPIDNLGCIPAKEYKIIEEYLKVKKPKNTIKKLEKIAKTIKASIETNFSIEDILLEVGDKRNSLSNRFIGF